MTLRCKNKRLLLESVDIQLWAGDPEKATTICFCRRSYLPDGPTWRVRTHKLTDFSKTSLRRLERALDRGTWRICIVATDDSMAVSYQLTAKDRTTATAGFINLGVIDP